VRAAAAVLWASGWLTVSFILQHAYYSVISPEGCASILWRNSLKAPQASEALKLHGEHLEKFGIVDEIIPEPLGGAHRDPEEVAARLKTALIKFIKKAVCFKYPRPAGSPYTRNTATSVNSSRTNDLLARYP
jgi:acetyl-CoA carboxylase alpha subunit